MSFLRGTREESIVEEMEDERLLKDPEKGTPELPESSNIKENLYL